MKKHILVIDDEQLVTDSIRRLLKKEGYDVTIAQNGAAALEIVKLKEMGFDLIIADIRIPEMDGIEIIKRIRQILKKPAPEILITGYASEESLKQAEELKVAGYVYKPFDVHEFMQVVRRNLEELK